MKSQGKKKTKLLTFWSHLGLALCLIISWFLMGNIKDTDALAFTICKLRRKERPISQHKMSKVIVKAKGSKMPLPAVRNGSLKADKSWLCP